MRKFCLALVVLAGALGAAPASAQNAMETVVVTGERAADTDIVPNVVLIRRADHIITQITILDDTRDTKMRNDEMKETLRGLLREAGQVKGLSLSLRGEILRDFTEARIPDVIGADGRPDTSRAVIIVKTVIGPEDTYESATARITAFVKRSPRIGRALINTDDDWELTVIGPQQYHPAVVGKVAQDAKDTAGLFGPDYGVTIEGLQHPVKWYRAGPLDLALYIPYTMTVLPRKAQ